MYSFSLNHFNGPAICRKSIKNEREISKRLFVRHSNKIKINMNSNVMSRKFCVCKYFCVQLLVATQQLQSFLYTHTHNNIKLKHFSCNVTPANISLWFFFTIFNVMKLAKILMEMENHEISAIKCIGFPLRRIRRNMNANFIAFFPFVERTK